jgi:hypothetical protein
MECQIPSQMWQNHPSYDDSHALIIVLKTFDQYAWDSHNFGSLSGVLGDHKSSTFLIRSGTLQKTLQYYNS